MVYQIALQLATILVQQFFISLSISGISELECRAKFTKMLKVCLLNGIGCLLSCALALVLLIPIVIENDTNHFNPLQVFLHDIFVQIFDFTKGGLIIFFTLAPIFK